MNTRMHITTRQRRTLIEATAIAAFFLAVSALLVTSALAAPVTRAPATRPTTAIATPNCVTAECHANVKRFKVLHAPLNDNACDACHELVSAKDHTFTVRHRGADMCTYCHEFNLAQKPVMHKPVTLGECLGCHDPHGGATRALVLEGSTSELCARCHEPAQLQHKFPHDPVAKGQCDSCHAPHASRFPKLLDAIGSDLCLACHAGMEAGLSRAAFRHKALDQGCPKCHNAHGSDQPLATTQPATDQCLGCHQPIKSQIDKAIDKHSVVMSDRGCLTCHTPHAGQLAKLIADSPLVLCMNCHREPQKLKDGRTLPAVTDILDKRLHKHGPIREGQCDGCHSVHGGERALLLDREYSAAFYQKFAVGKYDLCFKCHDSRLISEPRGATRFRNGETNLHYVHVMDPQLGRNCTVCHATHASENDMLVRGQVRFGKWDMPMRYAATATGGTCRPGCHAEWPYDREQAIARDAATQPARLARAPRVEPDPIAWSLQATSHATVTVPDPRRPTVMLFLGPERRQREAVLRQVAIALDEDHDAQVVTIACGPQAPAVAASVTQLPGMKWPVVEDAMDELSRQLRIAGWPATVVLDRQGRLMARIAGAPESLALRLRPYVEFAALPLERRAAATRPADGQPGTTSGAVPAATDGEPRWPLQTARRLLEHGEPDRALKVLQAALRSQPQSTSLQVEQVIALAALGRGPDAMKSLDAIPTHALPPAQRSLLRGKVLMAMQRWDDAREALADALVGDANLAEAHYLLGLIFEREKNWQKAAQSFRAYHDARKGK